MMYKAVLRGVANLERVKQEFYFDRQKAEQWCDMMLEKYGNPPAPKDDPVTEIYELREVLVVSKRPPAIK